ncbi:MAG: anthranilate synthase component II [Anaerolineae bacterium]
MILVIDNYDSFTYNLVQYLGELGADIEVRRNDAISVEDAWALSPDHIVISPGPGDPYGAGISLDLIKAMSGRVPILGVCLGHQCLAAAFGGTVGPARRLMHGKTSSITHDGSGILAGLPNPLTATRYHSLAALQPLPMVLQATAWAEDGEIMALRHRHHPSFGLQFHPESILTNCGHDILRRFMAITVPRPGIGQREMCRPNYDYDGSKACFAFQ